MLSDRAGDGWPIRSTDEPASLFAELETARSRLAAAEGRIADLLRTLDRERGAIQRLAAMATTDALTDPGNRRPFEVTLGEWFRRSVSRGSPLSVVMVDVDQFKSYNDRFGHAAGDEVLRIIAWQLMRSSRPGDVVTRYGGEEFAIVLPGADAISAVGHAERQRGAVTSFAWPLRPLTASFGVATRTSSIEDAAQLVEEADRALYASKGSGRNRVTHLGIAGGPGPTACAGEPPPCRPRIAGTNDPSRHSPQGDHGYADLGLGRVRG